MLSQKKKSVMLMGDFDMNYLHPLEKAELDTILTPYELNVLKNGDATKTTINSHNLIDYFIGDPFLDVIYCFNGDSCFKLSDYKTKAYRFVVPPCAVQLPNCPEQFFAIFVIYGTT